MPGFKKNFSRRAFSSLLGGAALAASIPIHRKARAQDAPTRFLAIRTPHGVHRDYWIPRNGDGSAPRTADEALSGLTFDYENAILSPLMNWREQITLLDGLDCRVNIENTRSGTYGAHGHAEQGSMLTGAQAPGSRDANFDGHPSLDFYLHGRLGAARLINAAVVGSNDWKAMTYNDAGRPQQPTTSPADLFRQIFPSDFVPPEPSDEPVPDYSAGERRVFGIANDSLAQLEARLSGAEKEKLAAHLAAYQRLTPDATGAVGLVAACSTRGSDVPSNGGSVRSYTDVAPAARAHASVIAQAFACDRARCATLRILDDYPNFFTELPEVQREASGAFGSGYRYHEDLVHGYWQNQGNQQILRGYTAGLRWSATHFAAVLEELNSIGDPLDPSGGTILDNTIVYWHNEFGHGPHDSQQSRHPVVIAGGGGKTLRLGRYLRLRDNIDTADIWNASNLVPHNKLLVAIAHAVGVTDIDYFGDRDLTNHADYRGPLEPLMA